MKIWNNVNWSYCKRAIYATIYFANDHLRRLKNWKDSAARKAKEAQAVINRENGTEKERDNKILFNNLLVFDIFVLLPVIIKQYMYGLV